VWILPGRTDFVRNFIYCRPKQWHRVLCRSRTVNFYWSARLSLQSWDAFSASVIVRNDGFGSLLPHLLCFRPLGFLCCDTCLPHRAHLSPSPAGRDRSNILCPIHPSHFFVDALKNRRRSQRVPGPGRVRVSPEPLHGTADREGALTDAVEGVDHPQASVDVERFAGHLCRSRCKHQE
jgi:hypothetical protein